jgi:hypothetical protein
MLYVYKKLDSRDSTSTALRSELPSCGSPALKERLK